MSEVFISYSRSDKEFVDGLIRDLEQRDIPVWVDRKDIGGGADWRAAISQAIRECRAFLLVLSPSSADSKKVTQELSVADTHNRPIIPIRYQPCDIPPEMDLQLAPLQWVDFTEQSYEAALEELLRALPSDTPRRSESPARPGGKGAIPAQRPAPMGPAPRAAPVNQAPAFTPPVATLAQMILGAWQIQISHPLGGIGTISLQMDASGLFRGQVMKPIGMTSVQGQWQVTPLNQLIMQGQETNGFQTLPYMVMIQFTQISPAHLIGMSGAGEQVVWQRIG